MRHSIKQPACATCVSDRLREHDPADRLPSADGDAAHAFDPPVHFVTRLNVRGSAIEPWLQMPASSPDGPRMAAYEAPVTAISTVTFDPFRVTATGMSTLLPSRSRIVPADVPSG